MSYLTVNEKNRSELELKVGYPTSPDTHRSTWTAGHKPTPVGVGTCVCVWFKEEIAEDGVGDGLALQEAVVNDMPKWKCRELERS
ncbi:hypothetical protein AVEN_152695-1 [Araneus ventricosus]|uniref:Uncharacterized protein n=1 Tax=Araneus ventricosus TaxID=182803 RepID=A0A4Y2QXI5_ARAVE|nr:hypothetical protein AVEN_152695-1 [Araneus ventricosus]